MNWIACILGLEIGGVLVWAGYQIPQMLPKIVVFALGVVIIMMSSFVFGVLILALTNIKSDKEYPGPAQKK